LGGKGTQRETGGGERITGKTLTHLRKRKGPRCEAKEKPQHWNPPSSGGKGYIKRKRTKKNGKGKEALRVTKEKMKKGWREGKKTKRSRGVGRIKGGNLKPCPSTEARKKKKGREVRATRDLKHGESEKRGTHKKNWGNLEGNGLLCTSDSDTASE